MPMNEMAFGRWLVEQFRKLRWHVTRIENTVSNGVPDVHVCAYGDDRWFELKVCDGLFTKAELRASQFKWHQDRSRAEGNSYIVILNKSKDCVALFHGCDVVKRASLMVENCEEYKADFEVPRKDFIKEFLKRHCVARDDDIRKFGVASASRASVVDA